jgi:lipopolysaccharide/colanic/teichoic acid biosynthesis glycosyltransferase
LFATNGKGSAVEGAAEALLSSTRDTDLVGWYRQGAVMGVLFTELPNPPGGCVKVLQGKMADAIHGRLTAEQERQIRISAYLFPESSDSGSTGLKDLTLYPDCQRRFESKKMSHAVKRSMDVVGSAILLLWLSPLLALIALAVKLTSKGPALFRQTRVGQFGRKFQFLKFRSMYVDSDPSLHKDYVAKFIAGRTDISRSGNGEHVFKIKHDPRVTRVGYFLRRTSLDELPQLFNVLKGEMSLVGPRPALPYEVERYQSWHRDRILEGKPGITGLWQVKGRSRLTFDEMVRLDLQYCRQLSLTLDLSILLRTPAAVLSGNGAY